MQDLPLFALASQRNRWLAARSSVIADNIANADTPGFKPPGVQSFDAALASARVSVLQTDKGHLTPSIFGAKGFDLVAIASASEKHSGNTVSLESELANLGEVRSQHSAVAGIVSAFHRMLLASVKG
jgi:flagellar basal-body rod protein FlgB